MVTSLFIIEFVSLLFSDFSFILQQRPAFLCGLSLRTLRTCLCLTAFSSRTLRLYLYIFHGFYSQLFLVDVFLSARPCFFLISVAPFLYAINDSVFYVFIRRFFKDICVCASVKPLMNSALHFNKGFRASSLKTQ